MRIGYHGVHLPEGKAKYNDPRMNALVEKCNPKKVSPYYVEFLKEEFVQCDAIVIAKKQILDLLILDLEKCEARRDLAGDSAERELLDSCIAQLEAEKPLCDLEIQEAQKEHLQSMAAVSLKPVVCIDGEGDVTGTIEQCFVKAGIIFFYTAGPKEVHAWQVRQGSDIVTCAGRIHTDLARGFIKGDIAGFDDFMSCHNWNDCQRKGLVRVVDRDYIITPGDIIEIRFNV